MSNTASPYIAFTANGSADREWQRLAACRSEQPTIDNIRERAELFFPGRTPGVGSERAMRRNAAAGKTICQSCIVTGECEDYRVKLGINYGTWGGRSETEREHGGRA